MSVMYSLSFSALGRIHLSEHNYYRSLELNVIIHFHNYDTNELSNIENVSIMCDTSRANILEQIFRIIE